MNGAAVALLLWAAALLQTTLLPALFSAVSGATRAEFLHGRTPDLLLLLLLYLTFHRPRAGACLWTGAICLLAGAFAPAWKGAGTASFLATGGALVLLSGRVIVQADLAVAGVAALVSFFEGMVHLQAGRALAHVPVSFATYLPLILVQALLNGLAAPLVHRGMRKVDDLTGYGGRRGRDTVLMDL